MDHDGSKPTIYRIERWLVKVTVCPLESRVMYRIVAAPDTKKAMRSFTWGSGRGPSKTNGNADPCINEPGPSRRPLGVDESYIAASPDYSFGDDMLAVVDGPPVGNDNGPSHDNDGGACSADADTA